MDNETFSIARMKDHGVGSTDQFIVINLVLSEYVCNFAIVKQYSWKIYGQTDTEEKRNRYLPSVKIRSPWGQESDSFPG